MRLSVMMATVAVAGLGTIAAQSGAAPSTDSSDGPPPYAATQAAAKGRQVPAQVAERFTDIREPRVVGADARGQEYALSAGSGGHCLIAVRGAGRPGFEACGPDRDEDMVTTTYMGEGRVRTVVLQARASSRARDSGMAEVAPGLLVSMTEGELDGG